MYVLKPYELFELLKQAVPQPNLTIENIAKLLYLYRDGNLPVKESTAYMNKVLSKIGVKAKGNRCLRGELCICFVHMKMCNRPNAPLGVDELCERYDLERIEVEKDPYFRNFCYYLCPVLDIVEPVKHSEFIIQNILVPLSGAHGIKYISGSKEAPRTRIRYKAFEIESHWFRPKTLSMIDGIEPRPSPRPTDGGLIMKRSIQFIADPASKIRLKSNKKVSDQSLPLSSGSLRVDKTDYITGTGNTITGSTPDTNIISCTTIGTTTTATTTTTTTTAPHNLNAYKPYLMQDSAVELPKGRRQASCPRPRKRKRPLTDSQNPHFGQPSSNSNNSNSSTMYANHEIFSNPYQKEEFKQPLCYTNNYETMHNRAQYAPDPQYVHNRAQYVPDPQYVHNQTQYVPYPRVQYVPDPQYVLDSQPGPQYVQNTSSTAGIHFVTAVYSQENSQEQCSQEYSEESQRNHHSALPLPHPIQQQYNMMMSCNRYIEEEDYSSHYMTEEGYNKPSFYPSYDGFIAIPLSESNYPTGRYAPSAALSVGNEVYRQSMYLPSDHLPLPPPATAVSVEHEDDELLQACTEALVKIGYNVKSLHVGV